MKKNLYYQIIFQRRNVLKEIILSFFLAVASWPRLVLEVFLRRNMGERYFSFSTAVIIIFFLAILPAFWVIKNNYNASPFSALTEYPTWYLFLAVVGYASYRRRLEVKRLPSVFDFERFSMSTGLVHPEVYKRFPTANIRTISTLIEPGICLVVGIALAFMKQPVGGLIIICSLIYGLSYMAAYYQGDHFVMDQIDKMICNEELVASFVDGQDASKTRGFEAYGRRPADPEMRRKVADSFFEEEEETVEVR